ncbi:hypothetical protein FSP39_020057 [Pinctada imbricata]|uniref:PHD-type domain-containing protein n=1 Tax=Pinctada imbricata TaxID=66713 RepID=A0AA88YFW5_PINIB|nr:hypothetical protein FSP39_020057 [Pinctada imbricata]
MNLNNLFLLTFVFFLSHSRLHQPTTFRSCNQVETLLSPHNISLQNTQPISNDTSVYYWLRTSRLGPFPSPHIKISGRVRALLLIISGLETNPGPRKSPKFPCGVCSKACKWGQRAIACDECDQWFHVQCMGMNSSTYEHLGNHSVSWYCTSCNNPNHSTTVYDSSLTCTNSFSVLSNSCSMRSSSPTTNREASTSSILDASADCNPFGIPKATSSPKSNTRNPVNRKEHQRNNIRIICINFQSIKNKVAELQVLIDSTNPDIIVGCETWTNQTMFSSEFLPDNYEVKRRDRGTDDHGGVLIATKKDLITSKIHVSEEAELLSVKIDLPRQRSMIVTAFYRPPNRTDDLYIQSTVREITELMNQHKSSVFVIGGDFNLPDIQWPNRLITGHSYPSHVNNQFINMADDLSLTQIVDFHTRKEQTLDLLFTSHPSLVDKCKCLPPLGKSDHDIVLTDTLITPQRCKPIRRKIYMWNKADMDSIKQELKEYKHTFMDQDFTDIDSMWNNIKTFTQDLIERKVPSKMTSNKFTNPWANRQIARLSQQKRRAHRRAKKTRCQKDWDRYKTLQSQAQREVRQAHDKYMEDIISGDIQENPKRFCHT